MSVPSDDLGARMQAFQEACTCRGVKNTPQRMEIYRELASREDHPDADAIYQRVRKHIPTISVDTVYRNLKLLAEHGLVSIVGTSNERLRFDANMRPHHHFVCVKCGSIRDFYSQRLEEVAIPDEAAEFGDPISFHVEVKCLCRTCRSRASKSS